MKITVFTATHNRADTLPRLYDSLKKQRYKAFEWLIVDDGSSDNTETVVKKFLQQKPSFPIAFIKQAHGGKHRAINRGLEYATGELFFLVDSDDYITENALETIIKWTDVIPDRAKCAGLNGLMVNTQGKAIGTKLKKDHYFMSYCEMIKSGITGDRATILFTSLFRKYRYPEFEGEWHIAPSVPFVRMARDGYKLLLFNEVVYVAEYLEDGLTKMGDRKILENFRGYTLRTRELLEQDIGLRRSIELIGKYTYLARQLGLSYAEICANLDINKNQALIFGTLARIYNSTQK